jgi:hypothetical protein
MAKSMLERIACALAASRTLDKFDPADQHVFRLAAREALKAMQVPTAGMVRVGDKAAYQRMVRAALKGA